MKQNRQSRIVAVLALCVSVIGLTLGFAAFSNTLTISSSATVTPDRKDFKLVGLGISQSVDLGIGGTWNPSAYTSKTEATPFYNNKLDKDNLHGKTAKISSIYDLTGTNQITISDIHATLQNPGEVVKYAFLIQNEGKYDAYLLKSELEKYANINDSTICTPVIKDDGTSATPALVSAACEGITFNIEVTADDQETYLSPTNNEFDYILLETTGKNSFYPTYPYGHLFITIAIRYDENAQRADGDFNVEFSDINLEFTTAPPTA